MTAVAGDPSGFDYTVTVDNLGPSDAVSDATVSDTLPAGFRIRTDLVAPCVGLAATTSFSCTIPASDLEVADPAVVLTIPVKVDTNVGQDLDPGYKNTVTVTTPDEPCSDQTPPANCDNNTDDEFTPVDTSVDLSVTKDDGGVTAVAGDPSGFDYTVTVDNLGPSDAVSDATVSDTLPAGFRIRTDLVAPCVGLADATSFTCTIPASDLQVADPAVVLTIPVKIDTNVGQDLDPGYKNTVTVTSPDEPCSDEPVPANCDNNTDDEFTPVDTDADLSIIKSDSPDPVTAGENLTYTMSVTNNGPSDAVNVVVVDDYDAQTSFVSASGDGWTCTDGVPAAGQLTCTRASLAAGETAPDITVVVKVDADVVPLSGDGKELSNTATVSSDTPDSDPGNNSDTEDTDVVAVETAPDVVTKPPATPVTPVTPVSPAPAQAAAEQVLAFTGSSSTSPLVALGALFVTLGVVALVTGRRRRREAATD